MTTTRKKTDKAKAKSPRWEDEFERISAAVPTEKGAEHFGVRLRWARAHRRMSLKDLAHQAGMTKPTLHIYEVDVGKQSRSAPRIIVAETLATLLQVSAPWLVFGIGEPEPPQDWQR